LNAIGEGFFLLPWVHKIRRAGHRLPVNHLASRLVCCGS
jgi:hypothetical protein